MDLEQRVDTLEKEMADLKRQLGDWPKNIVINTLTPADFARYTADLSQQRQQSLGQEKQKENSC